MDSNFYCSSKNHSMFHHPNNITKFRCFEPRPFFGKLCTVTGSKLVVCRSTNDICSFKISKFVNRLGKERPCGLICSNVYSCKRFGIYQSTSIFVST